MEASHKFSELVGGFFLFLRKFLNGEKLPAALTSPKSFTSSIPPLS
jgi:hypothetical protein